MIERDLDRRITIAHEIMTRLDDNVPLSRVLSQARSLANITGNNLMVALIDILTYGLTNVPYQPVPYTDATYKAAGMLYTKLCSMKDFSKLDINKTVERMKTKHGQEETPEKNIVPILSVYDMENLAPPASLRPSGEYETINLLFQYQQAYKETNSILARLRAYIYDLVSNVWIEATREKDRIGLLGPDYRFIADKLDTLETPVGGELLAAVDSLASANPASWGLSALGCRNVILKLGPILWKVSGRTYVTQSGDTLEVGKEKEKNRLFAYIDACSKGATADRQALLHEAKGLVGPIYDKGSKEKQGVRHAEAQKLVVDTFRLIELLNEATELKPIDTPQPGPESSG